MEGGVFLLVLVIPVILLVPSLAEWVGRRVRGGRLSQGASGASPHDLAATCHCCSRPLATFESACPSCDQPVTTWAQPAPGGALVDRPWIPLVVTLLLPILLFLISAIMLLFLLGGSPGIGGTGG